MDIVRTLVASVTDADLQQRRGDNTMLHCLWTVFDEEWAHRWYATRDLEKLVPRQRGR